jgi:hypothetical protein
MSSPRIAPKALANPTESLGPRAALLMSTPPIFARIVAALPPDQQSSALLWSKSTYSAVLKVRWRVIDMVRFRRYHPMFSDPVRISYTTLTSSLTSNSFLASLCPANGVAPEYPIPRRTCCTQLPKLRSTLTRPRPTLLLSRLIPERCRGVR